jgi:hypothetical protein
MPALHQGRPTGQLDALINQVPKVVVGQWQAVEMGGCDGQKAHVSQQSKSSQITCFFKPRLVF